MTLVVKALYCYPVKSCGGIRLESAVVGEHGILHDREYMVVDERGMFVSQRPGKRGNIGVKSMCLIKSRFESDRLVLAAPGFPDLYVPPDAQCSVETVQVWGDVCEAHEVLPYVSDWFTRFLSQERPGTYRLVRMRPGFRRPSSGEFADVQFADGYPFLVVSHASLVELNSRLSGEPVGMDRFRPNIVIDGCVDHFEDNLERFRVGDIAFYGGDLCDRCPIPGIDQMTGRKDPRVLRTLAEYRKTRPHSDKVQFGRNFDHVGTGRIAVGDVIQMTA